MDAKKVIFDVYTTLSERGFLKFAAVKEAAVHSNPQSTVWDIVNKPIVKRRKRNDSGTFRVPDSSDVDVIRRKRYDMYREQLIPTLKTLKQRLETDETEITCCLETLRKCLLENGFKMKTINKRQVV